MKARAQLYTPNQQMLNVRSHSSRLPSTKLEPPPMPALLNRRSTWSVSWADLTASRKSLTSSSLATSQRWMLTTRPCDASCSHSRWVSARLSSSTSQVATSQPSATNCRHRARPMPVPPPVTTASLPPKSFMSSP